MSPFNTFKNSGNSSSEVERSQRPNRVSRSESGSSLFLESRSLVIDRNLIKAKLFPLRPVLSCRNRIGKPSLSHTMKPTKRLNGIQMGAVTIVNPRSKNRFTIYFHTPVMLAFLVISLSVPTGKRAWAIRNFLSAKTKKLDQYKNTMAVMTMRASHSERT